MKKDKTTAYLLWCLGLIGICGIHRFYLGKIGTGFLWLFTIGLFGVGQLIDLFTLGNQVDVINQGGEIKALTATARAEQEQRLKPVEKTVKAKEGMKKQPKKT